MLKFAKYFFIVFFVTAVLPLILMFAWNNSQLEKMHRTMSVSGLNAGKTRLENIMTNNLKVQEGEILKTIYFTKDNNYNLEEVKKLLKGYNVDIVNNYVDKPVSFYEKKDFDLYSSTLLPYKNSRKSLKISKKLDVNQIRPTGPYNIEIGIEKDNGQYEFKGVVVDPLSTIGPKMRHRLLSRIVKFSDSNAVKKTVEIRGYNNDKIAHITLSLAIQPFGAKIDSIYISCFILFIGIISSFIIGLLIKRIFVVPVMALSHAAEEVKKGNLAYRLDDTNKYELVGNIYRSFNDMAENLAAKEKLRQSFISNLTHDLRTPLVSQSQSLELISDKFKEIGLQNEYDLAKSLAKNNEHLLKMVNLILESYSFDSSKLKLNIEKVDLYKIVQDCEQKLKPLINDKKLEFINNIYEGGVLIDADLFQLSRVFMNLLSNAIENTTAGNFIKVSAKFQENLVSIMIEDNGNGIAEEDLKFIFDRYYSGKSLERKLGSGFGLSVCEKLIKMHHGTISVESEINKYTKFTINLPVNSKEV